MGTLITDATTLFDTTTGFGLSDLVSWAGDILKMLLGAGLGLIQALMPWIIALLIIYGIVHLIKKGFGFFHVLG